MIKTEWFIGTENLRDAHFIRREVFIKEQQVTEESEMDGSDENALILVLYEGNSPVATGRLLEKDNQMTIGRIAVLKDKRGKKYGDFVMRLLIRKAYEMGAKEQYLHGQIQARGFYEKLGFIGFGDEFLEEGIPHIAMVHEGDVSGKCK